MTPLGEPALDAVHQSQNWDPARYILHRAFYLETPLVLANLFLYPGGHIPGDFYITLRSGHRSGSESLTALRAGTFVGPSVLLPLQYSEGDMLAKKIASIASAVALCFAVSEGNAAEDAFTSYPLGVLAFGAGITPPPGIYVTDAISFFSGNVGGNFDFGGRTFNSGVKADIFLDSTNILLVPQGKLLDGYFGASVTVPAGYVKYDASASGVRVEISSETSGGGWGDMNLQFQLGWDGEAFSHTIYLLGVIPTGRYDTCFSPSYRLEPAVQSRSLGALPTSIRTPSCSSTAPWAS